MKVNLPSQALYLLPVGVLTIICFGLYYSVLSAGWRFDDGAHLEFAMTYSPWQYFFMPEITRLQSGANLTPWNAFFYDINLSIFGLNPGGFYFHQLIILWLISTVTYFFLKLWLDWSWAILGATLFLMGAPTVHVANQIMAGHYTTGLLFTVIALYIYTRAVRDQNRSLALLSALFYLLAVTCKETYVPLIAILPFIPVGTIKERISYALPTLCIVIVYLVWRIQVLGRLYGGYNLSGTYDFYQIIETLGHIPFFLFGSHLIAKFLLVVMTILIVYTLYHRQMNAILVLIVTGLLLFPLIPLVSYPGITAPDRYLFLIWWGISLLIACTLSTQNIFRNKYWVWGIALVLIGNSLNHVNEEQKNVANSALETEKSYSFILNSQADQVYVSPTFDYYYGAVLPSIVAAQDKMVPENPARAQVIPDVEQLAAIDLTNTSVWSYDNHCQCVKDITTTVPLLVTAYQNKLIQRPLSVRLSLVDLKAEWHLGPYSEGEYTIMINNQGFFTLPSTGMHSYPRNTLTGYILYKSPEGWITKSEVFQLDRLMQPSWKWSRS